MSRIQLFSGPLPARPPKYQQWSEHDPSLRSAYDLTRQAEFQANTKIDANPSDHEAQENLISARVVGYLLIELFNLSWSLTPKPYKYLSREIRSESREHESAEGNVYQLGKWYRDHFIRMFRTSTTRYPTPVSYPSRPSFDTEADMTKDRMEADRKNYQDARLKVLARDRYQCVVTGYFDFKSVKENQDVAQRRSTQRRAVATINACHILSASTMRDVDSAGSPTSDKTEFAASALSILKVFGLEHLVNRLLPRDGVHDIRNLLSLEPNCHGYFDNLNMWFEHSEQMPGRYYVRVAREDVEDSIRWHSFLSTDDRGHPYTTFSQTSMDPDPELLDLHAVCARVAHMSGAAEVFDKLERDVDFTYVLASDGSSARLLDHLLTPLSAVRGVA